MATAHAGIHIHCLSRYSPFSVVAFTEDRDARATEVIARPHRFPFFKNSRIGVQ